MSKTIELENYRPLIQNLPVRQQSFNTRRDYKKWQDAENDFHWYRAFNNQHFGNGSLLAISRHDIFDINHNGSIRELILKTIYWGYPTGMRGNNFNGILRNMQMLERVLAEIKKIVNPTSNDFFKIAKCFAGIGGIGLSTYSKLLYFSEIKFDGYPCLILDRRLIKVFSSEIFDDYSGLGQINYDNARDYYLRYLKTTNEVAGLLRTNGENIEQFLFIFGNELKV